MRQEVDRGGKSVSVNEYPQKALRTEKVGS